MEFSSIKEFFNYIVNLGPDRHSSIGDTEIYKHLRILTEGYELDACKGALAELTKLKDEIKQIFKLKETLNSTDLVISYKIKRSAVKQLLVDNNGVVTATIDLKELPPEELAMPIMSLAALALEERYKNINVSCLDIAEKKLQEKIDDATKKNTTQTYFPDLDQPKIKKALQKMQEIGMISVRIDGTLTFNYKDPNNPKLPDKQNGTKCFTLGELSYFLRKVYDNPNDKCPWEKWEKLLSVSHLARSYYQIKDKGQKWKYVISVY